MNAARNSHADSSRKSGVVAALAALGLAASLPASAQQYAAPTVVMSGLDNPHGLTFGPDGGLYVAEAGSGGNGPSIVDGGGGIDAYGLTGGISRLLNGVQTQVVAGVPSLAPTGGGGAAGLTDLAFNPSGALYGITGFGTDPHERAILDAEGVSGDAFGQLVRFSLTDGSRQNVADVAAFEYSNPDGTDPDSQPYSLVSLSNGTFVVADAGGNDLLKANPANGAVSLLSVFPTQPGSYQPVPDSIVMGPDGNYYVGELTGFPYPAGAASIFRVNPTTGAYTVVATGFTNIADLAFSPNGTLDVLEISKNSLANPNGPVPGALLGVNLATGAKTLIADQGLVFPTGLTVGPDGSLYVSNNGTSPTGGQVLRFAVAPEPSALALLGVGALGLTGLALRARSVARLPDPHRENHALNDSHWSREPFLIVLSAHRTLIAACHAEKPKTLSFDTRVKLQADGFTNPLERPTLTEENNMEMNEEKLNALTPAIMAALEKAIEEAGLTGYELDSIRLAPKADPKAVPAICRYVCTMKGSHVFCHFDCSGVGAGGAGIGITTRPIIE